MRLASLLQTSLFRKALLIAAMSGTAIACQDNVTDPSPSQFVPAPSTSRAALSDQLDAVAKALAKAVADPAMRTFIRDAASKKADGDYNVLYSQAANLPISNGTTMAKALQQAQPADAAARTMPVNSITDQMPLLNISVPVHIDKWNVTSYAPLVVVLTNDEKAQLKAYDKDGNIHWLDPKKAPDFPVLVVGQSERHTLSATGQAALKKGLLKLPATGYNLMQDPGDGGGGGGGGGTGGGGPECTSLSSHFNISLTGWYTGDLSVIESWARGTPEIRMRAYAATQGGTKVDVYGDQARGNLWEPSSRSDIDGTWWNLNDYLFYWDINQYGEQVTFILHEEDGGDPKDITIPLEYKSGGFTASTSVTFRIDDGDDYVGYFPRRLPFCSGATVGNETLKFRVGRSITNSN